MGDFKPGFLVPDTKVIPTIETDFALILGVDFATADSAISKDRCLLFVKQMVKLLLH
jgi:uncharacterized linocin/CFP29 family protein